MGESAVYEEGSQSSATDAADSGGALFARTVADHLGLAASGSVLGGGVAGNDAIEAACEAIAAGRVDVALAGGVEPFSRSALLGFTRMGAVAPDACRPFASERHGLTLGEGAAFLVLESTEHAAARGAPTLARIGGLGFAAADRPMSDRPEPAGMTAAIRASLAAGEVDPSDVGWVSAHGAGSSASDAVEAAALHEVFLGAPPPISGLKGALGHTLGAATAVEAVLTVLALQDQVLPPSGGVAESDPQLALDVVLQPRPLPDLKWVLACGTALGGRSSALLLARP